MDLTDVIEKIQKKPFYCKVGNVEGKFMHGNNKREHILFLFSFFKRRQDQKEYPNPRHSLLFQTKQQLN